MERNSFTFYRSFEEAIATLSRKDQLLMYRSIVRYSLFGEEPTEEFSQKAKPIWTVIEPILNQSRIKSANGSKSSSVPKPTLKGNKNALKNKDLDTSKNEAKTKQDIDIDKGKELSVCDSAHAHAHEETHTHNFLSFEQWLKEHCPDICTQLAPLTQKEFDWLMAKYSKKEIADICQELENCSDYIKRHKFLFQSLKSFLSNKKGG